jgi:sigma-B regulation protein RsbU (phosphoserine phosphatase)
MSIRVRVEPSHGAPFERDFEGGEIVIGRAQTAGLVVTDTSVSRQHARLFYLDDRWWIEDLGARNRTSLNNQPLDGPSSLRAGDALRIGDTLVRVLGDVSAAQTADPRDSPADEPLFLKTVLGAEAESVPGDDTTIDRQAARLRTLNEIHRALATPISLTDLLNLILERCFGVLRPEEGVILLKQPDGQLRHAASRRLPGAQGEMFVSRRIVEVVAGKGQSALVLDAALDERFAGSDSIIASGVRSVVAAPLSDSEGTLGMIALYSRASVRQFSQQDLDLLVSLASAAALRVRNVELAEEAAARRVMEHELSLAHDMQMSMLPRRMPERPEIAVAAVLKPARSVGGDLYDFVLDGDRLWFIVGDVTGKGMAAALYMAVAKTLFRATAPGHTDLSAVVGRLNAELCRDNDRLVFVTALVGHLSLVTGQVAIADAGHNPALLVGRDGAVRLPAVPKGVALGIVETFTYAESTFTLEPGATLLLYTDGVTEAVSATGDLFGLERLQQTLATCADRVPETIIAAVVRDVESFVAGAPPEDDLTLLALHYRGPH